MRRQPVLPILFVPFFIAIQSSALAQSISADMASLLNSTGLIDVIGDNDARPSIATDGMGTWVAVWESAYDITGTGATREDILVARSTNNGATWTAPSLLNSTGGDTRLDTDAGIVTDRAGTWIAVWSSRPESGTELEDDLYFSRSTDGGLSWSPAALLNTNGNVDFYDDDYPCLAGDGNGNWIAVWNGVRDIGADLDFDIFISRSADDGVTWTSPEPVATVDMGLDQGAWVATDRQGNWLVAWNSLDPAPGSNDYQIMAARSADQGVTWSNPVRVNPPVDPMNARRDEAPQLVTDERGNWMVMWSFRPVPISGNDFTVVSAHSTDNGLTWTAPSTITTELQNWVYTGGGDFGWTHNLMTDRNGTWMVLWERVANTPEAYIYGSISQNNGASWGQPIQIGQYPSLNLRADMHPAFATDSQGNWVAVWQSPYNFDTTLFFEYDIAVTQWRLLAPDADQDLLPDAVETNTGIFTNASDTGTDPNNPDTDGDGYLDGIEVALGTDPNDPLDFPVGLPDRVAALVFLALAGIGAITTRRYCVYSGRQ